MGKFVIHNNKTLKLTNVIKRMSYVGDEEASWSSLIQQMEAYVRVHGAKFVGPLIQYVKTDVDDDGTVQVKVINMVQCDKFIKNIDSPYTMDSVLRVQNCMYCRYDGPEDKINYAFDKINVEAFEHDISLKGDSYTVFINRDTDNNTLVADIFMERVTE